MELVNRGRQTERERDELEVKQQNVLCDCYASANISFSSYIASHSFVSNNKLIHIHVYINMY